MVFPRFRFIMNVVIFVDVDVDVVDIVVAAFFVLSWAVCGGS